MRKGKQGMGKGERGKRRRRNCRIIDPSNLEETFKISQSNPQPSTAPVTPKPHQPAPDPAASPTLPGKLGKEKEGRERRKRTGRKMQR